MNRAPSTAIAPRKRWGLVAGFTVAALFPIVMLGPDMTPEAWAWFALFALNALIAATHPEIFF